MTRRTLGVLFIVLGGAIVLTFMVRALAALASIYSSNLADAMKDNNEIVRADEAFNNVMIALIGAPLLIAGSIMLFWRLGRRPRN
ncbi:MAG: hypothetical protein ACK55O_02065 [Phycisphaerales bacterium]|jgi:hypothetical protein|nr:hypothetical protein [Phycisphaeraceae bacterium]